MAKNGPGAANRSHNAEQKHHTIMAANTGPKGGFPAGRPEAHAAYLQTSGVNDLFERMLAAVLVEKPAARDVEQKRGCRKMSLHDGGHRRLRIVCVFCVWKADAHYRHQW